MGEVEVVESGSLDGLTHGWEEYGARKRIMLLGARIDREMTYELPEDLADCVKVGSRVLIPLGLRWTTGIVIRQTDRCELEGIKSVGLLLDPYPVLSERLLELCRWIAGYYVCSLSSVIKAALPAGIHTVSGQRVALDDTVEVEKDLWPFGFEVMEL